MDDYARAILIILFALIQDGDLPKSGEEMRKHLKDCAEEHHLENYERAIDDVVKIMYPPEDGTGSRHPY